MLVTLRRLPSLGLAALASVLILTACSPDAKAPPAEKAAEKAADKVAPSPEPMTPKWTATEGIDTPESVYSDPSGFIFVSNIAGKPDEKDGKGHISKLSGEGKVLEPKWVSGLNAPKGLSSSKGVLWTADIDEVIGIDIATARITTRVKIADAKFLNDVACGADGAVYVSDMMASKIYMVKDGKATVFAEGEDLEYPNGLLAEDGRLVVGGWGKPEADFSTKTPGRLFALDLKTKAKTLITPNPAANIDGLESDGKDGYIVSDWLAGKILHIGKDGAIKTLAEFKQGTADIDFNSLLIIPHMQENKIAAYEISGALK